MIRRLILLALTIFLIIFVINNFLSSYDTKECGVKPANKVNCQAVDAIVAISGGDTNARVDTAIELFKNGWSNKLIFAGAAKDKTGPSNAIVMRFRAIESGVPEEAIIIDEYSETTKQNATNTQEIFIDNDIRSIILVTSPYHQKRASLEFEKNTNVSVFNHPVVDDKDWPLSWWTTPKGWLLAGGEIVKIAIFYTLDR